MVKKQLCYAIVIATASACSTLPSNPCGELIRVGGRCVCPPGTVAVDDWVCEREDGTRIVSPEAPDGYAASPPDGGLVQPDSGLASDSDAGNSSRDSGVSDDASDDCRHDVECEDSLWCTSSACVAGQCVSVPIADACLIDGECWRSGSLRDDGCATCQPSTSPTEWREESTAVRLSTEIFHTCTIRSDRTFWCWGWNVDGGLGLGDRDMRELPTQVGTDEDWVEISAGTHSCGIKADRSLWCWGRNDRGQLGLGDREMRLVPVRVGTQRWASVSVGATSTCGIRSEGTLWCWGDNTYGQLGHLPSASVVTSPQRVGSLSGWSVVSAAEYAHACGIRTDGSMWCWGGNSVGQLGVGDTEPRVGQVRVNPDVTYLSVSVGAIHSCAIRGDQWMECWGQNQDGSLGVGDGEDRVSPTVVATVTWASVSAGMNFTCGLRTEGSLWCWGSNADQALGTSDTDDRVQPARVGVGTDWEAVDGGSGHTCGIASGRVLCWGLGDFGVHGVVPEATRNTPAPTSCVW